VVDSSVCSSACFNRSVAQILKNNDGLTLNCSVAIKDCAGNITYTTTFVFNDTSKAAVPDGRIMNSRIYPNPATDDITIELANTTPELVTIQDLLGRTVAQFVVVGSARYDLSALPNGTYIVRAGTEMRRIVKSN